jgi:carnosine N-methyltransferase
MENNRVESLAQCSSTSIGEFDCVVTCFFIDTAKNIVQYLEIIYDLLKPGGYWINFGMTDCPNCKINLRTGPLLYHYADMPGQLSIEISWEQIKKISLQLGFKLEVNTNH